MEKGEILKKELEMHSVPFKSTARMLNRSID